MKSIIAASAVLAVAGTASAFQISAMGFNNNVVVAPSVGAFVSEPYIDPVNVATDNNTWNPANPYRDAILSSSFLALDRQKPANFFGSSTGFGAGFPAPERTFSIGTGTGFGFSGGVLEAGPAGAGYGIDPSDVPLPDSAVSLINGEEFDSFWVGRFVGTEAGFDLTGEGLRVQIDQGGEAVLTFDGASFSINGSPYALRFERSGNLPDPLARGGAEALDMYVVLVPTPGSAALLGLAGLATLRRRR